MGRRYEEGRWTGRPEEELRNTQRLASKLQRMVKTGQGSPSILKQVDEYIFRRVSQDVSEILGRIDFLMRRVENFEAKEDLGQLYLSMVELLNEFESKGDHAYQSLLKTTRNIDPIRLNNLIDVDSELALSLSKLKETLKRLDHRNIGNLELQELHTLVDETFSILSARSKI